MNDDPRTSALELGYTFLVHDWRDGLIDDAGYLSGMVLMGISASAARRSLLYLKVEKQRGDAKASQGGATCDESDSMS